MEQILDVRTNAEYNSVHALNCKHIPLDKLNKSLALECLEKSDTIKILCKSGKRAQKASEKLKSWGFENLTVIQGGIDQWEKEGKDLVRSNSKMSLERQVRIASGLLIALFGILSLTVNLGFVYLSIFIGCGLIFAGISNTCGMGMLIAKMPWNN